MPEGIVLEAFEITLDELEEIQEAADGKYTRSPLAIVDGQSVAAEVCADNPCHRCAGPVRYVPVFHGGDCYRAFAVCDACQTAVEF
jgi:hypothetical protein